MTCKNFMDRISLYVQNELSEEETFEINEHLKECNLCSTKVEEINALLDSLSSFEDIEPPEDFMEKLSKRAEKELWNNKPKFFIYRKYIKYSSVAALFIVSILSVVYFNYSNHLKNKYDYAASMTSTADMAITGHEPQEKVDSDNLLIAQDKDGVSKNIENGKQYEASVDSKTAPANTAKNVTSPSAGVNTDNFAFKEPESDKIESPVVAEKIIIPDTKEPLSTPVPQDNGKEEKNTLVAARADTRTANEAKNTPVPAPEPTPAPTPAPETAQTIVADNTTVNQVQVKSKNIEVALNFIRDEVKKVNGTEIPPVSASIMSIMEEPKPEATAGIAAKKSVVDQSEKIVVEVSKENSDSFIKSLKDYFGESNVHIEAKTGSQEGFIRYEISITAIE